MAGNGHLLFDLASLLAPGTAEQLKFLGAAQLRLAGRPQTSRVAGNEGTGNRFRNRYGSAHVVDTVCNDDVRIIQNLSNPYIKDFYNSNSILKIQIESSPSKVYDNKVYSKK